MPINNYSSNPPTSLVNQFEFLFRRSSVPRYFATPYIACIWCCKELRDVLFTYGDHPATNGARSSSEARNTPRSVTVENNTNESNAPKCNCGIPCSCLTVKKEGPNTGKQFYGCSKLQGDSSRCNTFIVTYHIIKVARWRSNGPDCHITIPINVEF
jgi:hypothetical protein